MPYFEVYTVLYGGATHSGLLQCKYPGCHIVRGGGTEIIFITAIRFWKCFVVVELCCGFLSLPSMFNLLLETMLVFS